MLVFFENCSIRRKVLKRVNFDFRLPFFFRETYALYITYYHFMCSKTNLYNVQMQFMNLKKVLKMYDILYKQTILANYFLLPTYGKESIVLGSNFSNRDFEGFTHFEVP